MCSPSGKGTVSFAVFSRYYQGVSQGVVRDRDFEHILNAHWGFASATDVVFAMQKYCAMAGLAYAFQEQVSDGEGMGSVSEKQLHQGLQRIGLRLGPNDLERITNSFGSSHKGQIAIQELKELIINQRPEPSMPEPPPPPPQTGAKRPQLDLDLATLSRKLPYQQTPEAHAERRRMFDLIDMQSNGYLSVAELQRGIEDVLELPEVFDITAIVMRVVRVAKSFSRTQDDRPRTSERIQKREFRIILQCLSHYFELWLMFGIVDIASDSLITIQQFAAVQPKLAGWGLCNDDVSESVVFNQLNRNHNGQVLFADFCDWAVKQKINPVESDDDEQAKPSAPPVATRDLDIGSANIMDIDWSTIHEKLPYKRTSDQRAERRRLFSAMDMNGNGYLSLAEFDRGIQSVLQIQEVFDAKPAIMRAYQAAKNSMPSKSSHGADYVQRTEFRILLQFLAHYFELWCLFGIIDAGNDRRINLAEFTMAVPRLVQWGVRISKSDVLPIFNHIDRNHGGQVLFAEFCEWAIKQKLDVSESEDDMPQQRSVASTQVAQDRSLPQFQQVPETNFPDLETIHRKLPYDKDRLPERKKLFNAMDTNGNSYLSLAEVDKGIQDVLQLRELFDAKPAIMRAFTAAKNIVPCKRGHPGADFVTRTEFRILLQYLWHYFELWVHFGVIDTGGDRRISLQEFSAALPALANWGLHVQRGHEKSVFNQIDVNHGGSVLFAEFCEWAISHGATFDFNEDEDADWSKPPQPPISKPHNHSDDMVKNRNIPSKKQVDWTVVHLKLPHQRTTAARQQRRKLFRDFDVNGNGYLSLAEVDKGVRDVLQLDEVFDAKPVIMRAFQAAKNSVPADDIDSPAADYVQKMEFRILLQFLSHFFELWDLFGIIDTSHDRRLNLQEFTNILPKLSEWGIIVARGNERMVFNQIDRNHGGQVLFAEFCEWAIHLKLDLSDSDDDLPPRERPPIHERCITPVGIDWSSIPKKLPFERTPEARSQRRRLFSQLDVNANGYLSLAEVDKGIQDVLQIREIYDAKPVIIRAFNAARNCVPDEGHGSDYIQRREFRMMLQFMAHFFDLWVMFGIIDTSNNRCINLQEFILAVPRLVDWGVHITKGKEKTVFNQIDQNNGGQILFAELCEWAIAQKLDISDTDEEPMPNTPVMRAKSPALGMPTGNMNRLPTVGVQPQGRPRRRKALSIGINYFSLPPNHQLVNSVNDSNAMIQLLVNVMGLDVSDIRQLRDDQPHAAPTRAHILAGLSWLVDGAQPGD
jgi:Ca2+-binding EF-hand superfamily protein